MSRALELARKSEQLSEVPVGAVLVLEGRVIGSGFNRPIETHDPSAHAEIIAIRSAAEFLKNYRLTGTTLYVTLEPCSMCAGAILNARIARVVFGAHDPKSGAAGSQLNLLQSPFMNHQCQVVSGIQAEASRLLLQRFFEDRRSGP